jgi:hypothetical protein
LAVDKLGWVEVVQLEVEALFTLQHVGYDEVEGLEVSVDYVLDVLKVDRYAGLFTSLLGGVAAIHLVGDVIALEYSTSVPRYFVHEILHVAKDLNGDVLRVRVERESQCLIHTIFEGALEVTDVLGQYCFLA